MNVFCSLHTMKSFPLLLPPLRLGDPLGELGGGAGSPGHPLLPTARWAWGQSPGVAVGVGGLFSARRPPAEPGLPLGSRTPEGTE